MKRLISIAAIMLSMIISSCSTTVPENYTLDPNGKKGLLVISLLKSEGSEQTATYLSIANKDEQFIQNLSFKRNKLEDYYVIELDEGEYQLCHIFFAGYINRSGGCRLGYRQDLKRDIKFSVNKGEATYFGSLTIKTEIKGSYLYWSVADVTRYYDEELLKAIQKRYPNLDFDLVKSRNGASATTFLSARQ